MDLSSDYLGFRLKHPVMLGASPLVQDLGKVKQAEDAGVSAIVMNSLFQEQIEHERRLEERRGGQRVLWRGPELPAGLERIRGRS